MKLQKKKKRAMKKKELAKGVIMIPSGNHTHESKYMYSREPVFLEDEIFDEDDMLET